MKPGIYTRKKTDGTISYRTSITYKKKHISLGSYDNELSAAAALELSVKIINGDLTIEDYTPPLLYDKWVALVNFRDNGIYFSNPIYLRKNFFNYYYSPNEIFTFDADDLFFYSTHKIQKRGQRLFVADYGMQLTLKERYGIKPYAVCGRDYIHINGDSNDYRYENLRILSSYKGVYPDKKSGYISKILAKGNSYTIIGRYPDEITAAVAYNKASEYLNRFCSRQNQTLNYIEGLSSDKYSQIYDNVDITYFISKMKK